MIDATTTTPTGAAVPYERLDFVLDPEHEAHEPPEVGGPPARRRAPARERRRRRAGAHALRRPRRVPRRRRPRRGEHVGDRPRGARRPAARRRSRRRPLLGRAARRRGAGRGAPAGRRHDRAAARGRPGSTSTCSVPAGCVCHAASPARDASGWRRPTSAAHPTSPTFLAAPRATDPLPPRPARVADRGVPDGVRREPGSAEMPSAARPFTAELVTDLVGRGDPVAPLLLHTGVSSLEGDERPYPERYRVPRATADAINADAPQRRPRGRHRHHRRPRARHRHRRPRRRAPRARLDRGGRDSRARRCARSTGCSPAGTSRSRRT